MFTKFCTESPNRQKLLDDIWRLMNKNGMDKRKINCKECYGFSGCGQRIGMDL